MDSEPQTHSPTETVTLSHPEGIVRLESVGDGRTHVTVEPFDRSLFVSGAPWTTHYPPELIESILAVKGPAHVCDEIRRDEDPNYVALTLHYALLGYVDPAEFANRRLLDFGCGSGASTSILGRMFPDTEIVGVELEAALLDIARKRAALYGNDRVRFELSPSGDRLPDNLGSFDFVALSAVFEHLLPSERKVVLGQIWSVLKPGGIFFLNQTPFRFYPQEAHTTGLPGLNYLPDRVALRVARRFSSRVSADETWETLLRRGIRGGTEREVMRILSATRGGEPVSLKPHRLGLRDTVDLWYECSMQARPSRLKPVMRMAFKGAGKATGSPFAPAIDLAISQALSLKLADGSPAVRRVKIYATGRRLLVLVQGLLRQLGATLAEQPHLDVVAGVVVERDQREAVVDQRALVGGRRARARRWPPRRRSTSATPRPA